MLCIPCEGMRSKEINGSAENRRAALAIPRMKLGGFPEGGWCNAQKNWAILASSVPTPAAPASGWRPGAVNMGAVVVCSSGGAFNTASKVISWRPFMGLKLIVPGNHWTAIEASGKAKRVSERVSQMASYALALSCRSTPGKIQHGRLRGFLPCLSVAPVRKPLCTKAPPICFVCSINIFPFLLVRIKSIFVFAF
jgi:hypothetical protein